MNAIREITGAALAVILAGTPLFMARPAAAQGVEVFRPPPAVTPPTLRFPAQRLPTRVAPPFFRPPTTAEVARERRALRRSLDGSTIDPTVPRARAPVAVPRASAGTREVDRGRRGALAGSDMGIPAQRIEVTPAR